jgi:putative protein kinase ArgK-like GTPase of G3E family
VRTVATERSGLDALVAAIAQHRQFLLSHRALEEARAKRAEARLSDLAGDALLRALKGGTRAKPLFEGLSRQVRGTALLLATITTPIFGSRMARM